MRKVAGVADAGVAGRREKNAESQQSHGKGDLDKVNWKTDLSGGIQRVGIKHGCAPFGNARARAVVWKFPDPVPIHREPLYTPRYDLVAKYPTYEDRKILLAAADALRVDPEEPTIRRSIPLIFTSGRLVEYEGGGERDALQPVARRAAAEHVRRDQSGGCQRPRHQGRPMGLAGGSRPAPRSRSWPWSRRASAAACLDAVPLRRLVRGQGPARALSRGHGAVSCAARPATTPRPTATTR